VSHGWTGLSINGGKGGEMNCFTTSSGKPNDQGFQKQNKENFAFSETRNATCFSGTADADHQPI
jgi:hypothetical protein